tara:strand:- start:1963 stop:2370 length:408 start_codon:yes stop_codon:yes gene_type:complete
LQVLNLFLRKGNVLNIRQSSRQFFWLFIIIGFFLAIFLWVSEYFSHQIFVEELARQVSLCSESTRRCDIDELLKISSDRLNANQAKIIELNSLVNGYYQFLIKTLYIFIIFILIGCIPAIKDFYYEIQSYLNLKR